MAAAGGAGKWLADAARRAAQSDGAKRALAAAATGTAKALPGFVRDRLGRRRATRQQQKLAEALARQVGGRLSYDTVIDRAYRVVVWSDGKPLQAFPPPDGDQPLAERPELKTFDHDLLEDPPPAKPRKRKRGGA